MGKPVLLGKAYEDVQIKEALNCALAMEEQRNTIRGL